MNRYTTIALLALLVFVVSLPIYASREEQRLAQAQADLRERVLAEAAVIYVENCATCHGTAGEGLGLTPSLNKKSLAEASPEALFRVIARAAHGSTMASWHTSEGGILNNYQIGELVTLIQANEWQPVLETAKNQNIVATTMLAEELLDEYMQTEDVSDPHACMACHEEPDVHLGQFGVNCGRCHSPEAWTPAFLVRHNFPLDHGGQAPAPCQTCHVDTYTTNTCYQCHDHKPEEMVTVHMEYDIVDINDCITCHPTGVPGEAEELLKEADAQASAQPLRPGITVLNTP